MEHSTIRDAQICYRRVQPQNTVKIRVPEENGTNGKRDVGILRDAKSTSVDDTCVCNSKHDSIESHGTRKSFCEKQVSDRAKLNESSINDKN